MKYFKAELYSSFTTAALAIEEHVADGWQVNEDDLPDVVGFSYYVSFVRDDEPVVKLTRAEILAKARAAKTAKKQGEQD